MDKIVSTRSLLSRLPYTQAIGAHNLDLRSYRRGPKDAALLVGDTFVGDRLVLVHRAEVARERAPTAVELI